MSDIEDLIDRRFRVALEIAMRSEIDATYRTSQQVVKWANLVEKDAAQIQGEPKVTFLAVLAGRLQNNLEERQDQNSPSAEAIRSCLKFADRFRDVAALNALGGNATHH